MIEKMINEHNENIEEKIDLIIRDLEILSRNFKKEERLN